MEFHDSLFHSHDFHLENGACGQSQRQQKHEKYDLSLLVIIFTGKKAPAAGFRHDRNKVDTGLTRTSSEFTGLHRSSRKLTETHRDYIELNQFYVCSIELHKY